MELSLNAIKILEKRYFAPGETWEALCARVAAAVASAEESPASERRWGTRYQEMMENLDFLPNSPTLRNFGRNRGCGSACFVLPIEDSRRSIFRTLADAVDVQAFGGGTGMSFSRIRPAGDPIHSTGGKASGPLSFLRIFDLTIGDIIRQGGTRNGANMGILRIDHPDVEAFIAAKSRQGMLGNFNLSVAVSDGFMRAVQDDAPFELVFEGRVRRTVPARALWEQLIQGAWENGEPGIVFIDTVNRHNPLRPLGEIEATNPCGEQPLLPYGSCNLGSINLARMARGDWIDGPAQLDRGKLKATVGDAVRFLDAVISVNAYPLPEIEAMARRTRQIGLGVMGFADLCIKLHVRYGSEDSANLAREVMGTVHSAAEAASAALGQEKGPAPVFDENDLQIPLRRNGTLTTVAPTGTLSLLADCSSGCEPHFAFEYSRACLEGERLDVLPAVLREWTQRQGPGRPEFFVTAAELSVADHIRVQAAFQTGGVDAAVSKTINAPADTTVADVSEAFFLAWRQGCKGITFYRDGSRDLQVLTAAGGMSPLPGGELVRGDLKDRPRATTGPSLKMKTACGKLYVDPHFDGDGIAEVFIRTVGGGCAANTKALGVLMSYCLRAGISPEKIIRSMKAIHCPACTKAISAGRDVEVNSCAAGMGKGLEVALENGDLYCTVARRIADADRHFGNHGRERADAPGRQCPDCGAPVRRAEGCMVCVNPECGWTRC